MAMTSCWRHDDDDYEGDDDDDVHDEDDDGEDADAIFDEDAGDLSNHDEDGILKPSKPAIF